MESPPESVRVVRSAAGADIQGGQAAGCRTGWVSHGQDWELDVLPTVQAPSTLEVLELISEY